MDIIKKRLLGSDDQKRGVHPDPLRPWCIFRPVSNFPPIFEKFSDSVENLKDFQIFIRQNYFWWLFLNFPPVFPVSVHFPSVSRKLLFPHPTFTNFLPVFVKFPWFLHTFCVYRFPLYFHHDAFMHHPMHVLDAPGSEFQRVWFSSQYLFSIN